MTPLVRALVAEAWQLAKRLEQPPSRLAFRRRCKRSCESRSVDRNRIMVAIANALLTRRSSLDYNRSDYPIAALSCFIDSLGNSLHFRSSLTRRCNRMRDYAPWQQRACAAKSSPSIGIARARCCRSCTRCRRTSAMSPEAAVPMVAEALNLSRAEVHGVVTFYHDFRARAGRPPCAEALPRRSLPGGGRRCAGRAGAGQARHRPGRDHARSAASRWSRSIASACAPARRRRCSTARVVGRLDATAARRAAGRGAAMSVAHLHSPRCRRGRGRRRRGRAAIEQARRAIAVSTSRSSAPARAASTGSSRWSRSQTPAGRIAYGPVTAGDVAGLLDAGRRPAGRIRCASVWPTRFPCSSARPGSPSRAAASSIRSRSTIIARMAATRACERALALGAGGDRRGGGRSPACAAAAAPASRPASSGAPSRQTQAAAEIHRLQRRRGRQRHLRRPHDHGRRSLRPDRRHDDRRHRRRRDQGLHLYPLRISARRSRRWRRRSRRRGAAACSAGRSRTRLTRSTSKSASAPAPMSAARKPRCSKASRASAAMSAPSRRCRRIKGLFGKPTVINNVLSLRLRADHPRRGRGVLSRFRHGPLARHHADPARRQRQAWRPVRDRVRHHARRAGRRHRRRHRERPAGARGAGRRPARRLFPARAVRHAVRLRGLRRPRRADRPWRHRRVRRQRRHGEAGALRHGILRASKPAASARPAGSARPAASR